MKLKHRTALSAILLLSACATQQPAPAPTTTTSLPTSTTTTTTTSTTLPPTTTTIKRIEQPVYRTPPQASQCPQPIIDLIHKHFDRFGVEVAEWFTGIVWRESNCQPDAVNRSSGCYGLSQQALPLHKDMYAAIGADWTVSWMDPDINLLVAANLYAGSGRGPWQL